MANLSQRTCMSSYTPQFMVLLFLCLLGLFSPTGIPGVQGEVFSSMAALRNLVYKRHTLLDNLELYVQQEERRLTELHRLVVKMRENIESQPDIEEAMQSVQHPAAAYTFIRDWSFLADLVNENTALQDLGNNNRESGSYLPTTEDRLGALHALIRLQRTYNISAKDLAAGNVWGHISKDPLNGRDFFDLGTVAFNKNLALTALPWFNMALENRPDDLPESEILYQIGQVYNRRSEFGMALETLQKAMELDPNNQTIRGQYDSMKQVVEIQGNFSTYKYQEFIPDWKLSYEALCRRAVPQTGYINPQVACEYHTRILPYVQHKVEILSRDPWIVMYYDVISSTESDVLKQLATPELNRAVVGDPASSYATEERISKVAWLWDKMGNTFIDSLSHRIEEVTGLTTEYHTSFSNAEPFQVVNYGMGGQYEPHVDVYENINHLANVPEFLQGMGDRVATFMFYLSKVQEGGATVFPLLNIYVPPVKNAAAFWYNIHRNGTLDLRTQHAGCPVLVGEKWVANKWIREYGQFLRRPCGPTEYSTEPQSRQAAGR